MIFKIIFNISAFQQSNQGTPMKIKQLLFAYFLASAGLYTFAVYGAASSESASSESASSYQEEDLDETEFELKQQETLNKYFISIKKLQSEAYKANKVDEMPPSQRFAIGLIVFYVFQEFAENFVNRGLLLEQKAMSSEFHRRAGFMNLSWFSARSTAWDELFNKTLDIVQAKQAALSHTTKDSKKAFQAFALFSLESLLRDVFSRHNWIKNVIDETVRATIDHAPADGWDSVSFNGKSFNKFVNTLTQQSEEIDNQIDQDIDDSDEISNTLALTYLRLFYPIDELIDPNFESNHESEEGSFSFRSLVDFYHQSI